MTPMLQVSPLSPERVWAIWDSGTFISSLDSLSHRRSYLTARRLLGDQPGGLVRLKILSFFLLIAPVGLSQSRIQPAITPNGIVNAASYVAPGFVNHGIARGSMFL